MPFSCSFFILEKAVKSIGNAVIPTFPMHRSYGFQHLWHKRPTFAFVGKSEYTLGFRRKIAHSGSQGEAGRFGWGWYHYPRRALRAAETPDVRLSKRLICRFLRLPSSTPCAVTFSADIQISLSVISVANAFALWYDKSHKSGLFGDEGEPE